VGAGYRRQGLCRCVWVYAFGEVVCSWQRVMLLYALSQGILLLWELATGGKAFAGVWVTGGRLLCSMHCVDLHHMCASWLCMHEQGKLIERLLSAGPLHHEPGHLSLLLLPPLYSALTSYFLPISRRIQPLLNHCMVNQGMRPCWCCCCSAAFS
jgi:hypothetical protein